MFRRPLGAALFTVLIAAPAAAQAAGQSAAQGTTQAAAQATAQGPRIAEVQLAPPFVRMVPDAQVQASATAYDSSGTPMVVRFRWSSSNINVATVSENGLVRAIAPGIALVSASYEGQRGGRRRAMQVQVLSRVPSATGIYVSPVPPGAPAMPVPGMPPAGAAPGMPPGVPTMVYVSPHGVDSMMKASVNCAEPMINAVNPLQACYDQRPTPRLPAAGPLPTCPDQPSTFGMGVLVMVKVSETGAVSDVMPYVRNGCPQLVDAALAAARAMTFNPALRDGRPISAWARVVLHTPEPPPKQ